MIKALKRFILGLAVAASLLVPSAPALAATNPFSGACSNPKAAPSAVCPAPTGDGITTKTGIIWRVTTIVAIFAGVAAVIVLAIGGVRYIASNGDAEQVTRAKRTIMYAIIGLAVVVLGQAIINLVLNRIT